MFKTNVQYIGWPDDGQKSAGQVNLKMVVIEKRRTSKF